MLDGAVLAGGIHRLKDHQDRPGIGGVEPFLGFRQLRHILGEQLLGVSLALVFGNFRVACPVGIIILEADLLTFRRGAWGSDHRHRHDRHHEIGTSWGSTHSAGRPAWTTIRHCRSGQEERPECGRTGLRLTGPPAFWFLLALAAGPPAFRIEDEPIRTVQKTGWDATCRRRDPGTTTAAIPEASPSGGDGRGAAGLDGQPRSPRISCATSPRVGDPASR